MGDARNDHEALCILDRVDDAVVAHTHAEVVPACELYDPDRPRINGKTVDDALDSIAQRSLQSSIFASRGGL